MRTETFLWIVAGIGCAWTLMLLAVLVIAVREAIGADRVLRESHERFERWLEEGRKG